MQKNAIPLERYLMMALVVYVTGLVVAYLFYEAQAMVGGIRLAGGDPLTDAAAWPLALLQVLL